MTGIRKLRVPKLLIALEIDVDLLLSPVEEDRGETGNGDRAGWKIESVSIADPKALLEAVNWEIEHDNNEREYARAVEQTKAGAIIGTLGPFVAEAGKLTAEAGTIVVTDAAQDKADREAKERAAKAEAAQRAAPDIEKVRAFAVRIRSVECPACATQEGRDLVALALSALLKLAQRIDESAAQMGA